MSLVDPRTENLALPQKCLGFLVEELLEVDATGANDEQFRARMRSAKSLAPLPRYAHAPSGCS